MKKTIELENQIKKGKSVNDYDLDEKNAKQIIIKLIDESGESKSLIGNETSLGNYIYEITDLTNKKKPARDRLIVLLVYLKADIELISQILKLYGYSPLYVKIKRDYIIYQGIINNRTLDEINDELYQNNENTLIYSE